MNDEEQIAPIDLSDLDALGILDHYGSHSPQIERVQLSYIDARTILAVGFGGCLKGRRKATGRVAWLLRECDGWLAEQRSTSCTLKIVIDPTPDDMLDINTSADLDRLVEWLKGGSL